MKKLLLTTLLSLSLLAGCAHFKKAKALEPTPKGHWEALGYSVNDRCYANYRVLDDVRKLSVRSTWLRPNLVKDLGNKILEKKGHKLNKEALALAKKYLNDSTLKIGLAYQIPERTDYYLAFIVDDLKADKCQIGIFSYDYSEGLW